MSPPAPRRPTGWRDRLPTRESVESNRWLRWLGPALQHPRLWHVSRRGIALGVAIGVFFGFLIPIAQIPFSAAVAVVLKANVPSAMASTFVTNPVTFAPVYYAAWRTGKAILGDDGSAPPALGGARPPAPGTAEMPWWQRTFESIRAAGRPLLLGLALFACGFAVLAYLLVTLIWRLKVVLARRRRTVGRAG